MKEFQLKEITRFSKEPLPLDLQIAREDTARGRFYRISPEISYPSITTLLSIESAEAVKKWQQRVGERQAEEIKNRSANRGTTMHNLLEKYLDNDLQHYQSSFYAHEMFMACKKVVDARVSKVYLQEAYLYSKLYQVAGTCDLVCEFDGSPAIVDFKNSIRKKSVKDIHHYILQLTCYSLMLEERTGLQINNLHVIMAVEGENVADVFSFDASNHRKEFANFRVKMLREHGI